jgi:hypothetical protein
MHLAWILKLPSFCSSKTPKHEIGDHTGSGTIVIQTEHWFESAVSDILNEPGKCYHFQNAQGVGKVYSVTDGCFTDDTIQGQCFVYRYYAVCFLNQLILSKNDSALASSLITIYFSLFKVNSSIERIFFNCWVFNVSCLVCCRILTVKRVSLQRLS